MQLKLIELQSSLFIFPSKFLSINQIMDATTLKDESYKNVNKKGFGDKVDAKKVANNFYHQNTIINFLKLLYFRQLQNRKLLLFFKGDSLMKKIKF